MRKVQVVIYYNEKEGYIFFPFGIMKNGPRIIIEPGIKKGIETSASEITDLVLECLNISKESMPIEKKDMDPNLVLKVSGMDNQKKFDKAYKFIICEKKENNIYISDRVIGSMKCIPCENKDEIGMTIACMSLEKKIVEMSNIQTFTTLNNNIVSYSIPSDDFNDIGDGHTDAYQIFEYGKDNISYIAFVIDNGYKNFNEASIKNRWKEIYGEIHDFQYIKNHDSILKMMVSAKTNSVDVISCFFKDGDSFLEVMTEVNKLILTKDIQKTIRQEFNKLVESVKLVQGV